MRHPKQYTVEQFLANTRIVGASFSHDETQILFSSNRTGVVNAYSVSVTGGDSRQLTHSTTENTYGRSFFPNDSRILIVRDQDGKERHHLYVLNTSGNELDLVRGDAVVTHFLGWSHDGNALYYRTNERDASLFDIYRVDTETYKRELLYQDRSGLQFTGISSDERYIAFIKYNTREDSDIYLFDASTKETSQLTSHSSSIRFRCATFDPTGHQYLYYITDQDREFSYLVRRELSSGRVEVVEEAPWDIGYVYFSHNGKYRVVAVTEDAGVKVRVTDHATGRPHCLPRLPEGDIISLTISRSERLMAFNVNGDRSPSDLYVYDFGTTQIHKLIDALNPEIDRNDLSESRITRFRSFDGLEISSLLWEPKRPPGTKRAPALIWAHGGPGGQTIKGYHVLIQFLVNHGYVVLGVNYRGSCGYGKTFLAADERKHGREPLWDCVEAKKCLEALGYVDTTKIGIIGGSYGGYMVLAALTFKPEEFVVGVDLFGVSNWVRTLESCPPYWKPYLAGYYKNVGDPKADQEELVAISPLFHAHRISKPLLVLQGANDPRVVKAESDEIVQAIKNNNGVVEYLVFDDEGHGLTKTSNEVRAYKGILEFLERYLKGQAALSRTGRAD